MSSRQKTTIAWNVHIFHDSWMPCGRSVKRNREWRVLQSRTAFRLPPSYGRTSSKPSSRVLTLCLHGSRIALFFAALAIQIFGRKERATVVTLSVEFFIIALFLVMGVMVMRLFSKDNDEDEVGASAEKQQPLTGSQHGVPGANLC